MKLLLDTCVWGGAVQSIRDGGHDTVWTGEWAVALEEFERALRATRPAWKVAWP